MILGISAYQRCLHQRYTRANLKQHRLTILKTLTYCDLMCLLW